MVGMRLASQEGYEKRKEFVNKNCGEGIDKGEGFNCFLDSKRRVNSC
jgi:hypothetical protein